ncbi:MAG: trimeric LpxA-like protein [Linnemannia gamsii]|nr:MAG: trimeric LpxA-like protein [Linnemannia gamsii]
MSSLNETRTRPDTMHTKGEINNHNHNYSKRVLSLSVQEYATQLEKEYNITLLPPGLDTTAEDNMLACRIYDCMDPLLVLGRQRSNDITALYNALVVSSSSITSGFGSMTTTGREEQEQVLDHKRQALLYLLTRGQMSQGCKVEPPIQVDYGHNTTLGNSVLLGSNTVLLDCARITIGDRTILGPGVKLLGATHPLNPLLRYPIRQFDYAMEIRVGKDCCVGAGAVLCPGVVIGDGVMVLEGSVVTKSVLPGFVVIGGCPARVVRVLERVDVEREGGGKVGDLFDNNEWKPPVVGTMELP